MLFNTYNNRNTEIIISIQDIFSFKSVCIVKNSSTVIWLFSKINKTHDKDQTKKRKKNENKNKIKTSKKAKNANTEN